MKGWFRRKTDDGDSSKKSSGDSSKKSSSGTGSSGKRGPNTDKKSSSGTGSSGKRGPNMDKKSSKAKKPKLLVGDIVQVKRSDGKWHSGWEVEAVTKKAVLVVCEEVEKEFTFEECKGLVRIQKGAENDQVMDMADLFAPKKVAVKRRSDSRAPTLEQANGASSKEPTSTSSTPSKSKGSPKKPPANGAFKLPPLERETSAPTVDSTSSPKATAAKKALGARRNSKTAPGALDLSGAGAGEKMSARERLKGTKRVNSKLAQAWEERIGAQSSNASAPAGSPKADSDSSEVEASSTRTRALSKSFLEKMNAVSPRADSGGPSSPRKPAPQHSKKVSSSFLEKLQLAQQSASPATSPRASLDASASNSPRTSNGRVASRKKNLVFERPAASSTEGDMSKPSSIHKRGMSASLMEKIHAVSGGINMPQEEEEPGKRHSRAISSSFLEKMNAISPPLRPTSSSDSVAATGGGAGKKRTGNKLNPMLMGGIAAALGGLSPMSSGAGGYRSRPRSRRPSHDTDAEDASSSKDQPSNSRTASPNKIAPPKRPRKTTNSDLPADTVSKLEMVAEDMDDPPTRPRAESAITTKSPSPPKNLMAPPTSSGGKHRRGKSVLDRMKGLEGMALGIPGGFGGPRPSGSHRRSATMDVGSKIDRSCSPGGLADKRAALLAGLGAGGFAMFGGPRPDRKEKDQKSPELEHANLARPRQVRKRRAPKKRRKVKMSKAEVSDVDDLLKAMSKAEVEAKRLATLPERERKVAEEHTSPPIKHAVLLRPVLTRRPTPKNIDADAETTDTEASKEADATAEDDAAKPATEKDADAGEEAVTKASEDADTKKKDVDAEPPTAQNKSPSSPPRIPQSPYDSGIVDGDKVEESVEKDERAESAKKDESGESAEKDESGEIPEKDESGDSAEKDESAESTEKDESLEIAQEDESAESAEKDESGDSAERDESAESTEKDESLGSAQKDESASVGVVEEEANDESAQDESAASAAKDESAENAENDVGDQKATVDTAHGDAVKADDEQESESALEDSVVETEASVDDKVEPAPKAKVGEDAKSDEVSAVGEAAIAKPSPATAEPEEVASPPEATPKGDDAEEAKLPKSPSGETTASAGESVVCEENPEQTPEVAAKKVVDELVEAVAVKVDPEEKSKTTDESQQADNDGFKVPAPRVRAKAKDEPQEVDNDGFKVPPPRVRAKTSMERKTDDGLMSLEDILSTHSWAQAKKQQSFRRLPSSKHVKRFSMSREDSDVVDEILSQTEALAESAPSGRSRAGTVPVRSRAGTVPVRSRAVAVPAPRRPPGRPPQEMALANVESLADFLENEAESQSAPKSVDALPSPSEPRESPKGNDEGGTLEISEEIAADETGADEDEEALRRRRMSEKSENEEEENAKEDDAGSKKLAKADEVVKEAEESAAKRSGEEDVGGKECLTANEEVSVE